MRRLTTRLGNALALALVLPLSALAGGWATVTLDSTPTDVTAGKAFELGFTVLQHGKTPLDGLTPRLHFSHQAATRTAGLAKGEVLSFKARPEGKVGHYSASVTLPEHGTWTWEVEAFGAPAQMKALSVAAPAKAPDPVQQAQPAVAATAPPVGMWILAGAAVLALCALVLLLARRPRRSAA